MLQRHNPIRTFVVNQLRRARRNQPMSRRLLTPSRVSAFLFCLSLLAFCAPAGAGVAPVKVDPDEKNVNSGDTAWMLTSSALVLMMTGPGLALFYGGLVRRKNVLGTMMQSFILMCVVTVVWALIAYSLA